MYHLKNNILKVNLEFYITTKKPSQRIFNKKGKTKSVILS
jgi:hypothetical protein